MLLQAGKFDAVGLGPGLSTQPAVKAMVQRLVQQWPKPLVVDADGLNVLVDALDAFKKATAPRIITPHPGELARLLLQPVETVQHDRAGTARRAAQAWRCTVVLKGHQTVVAHVDGAVYVNDTGHAGMASGGMGDVLAGMITSLLGQGLAPFDAAKLGVYLHGAAGELARASIGEAGLLASDVAHTIPQAICAYLDGGPT